METAKIVPYFVYMLRCADGSLYTGITNDLESRLAKHASGKGSKYVRSRLPIKLVFSQIYENKSLALKREVSIKSLSKTEKELLISGNPV